MVWLLLPLAAGVVVALASGGASADEKPPPTYDQGVEIAPLPDKDIQNITDVRAIFQRDCATCHGANGLGTARAPTLQAVGRASVYYWVSTGRMPMRDDSDRFGRRPARYPPAIVNRLVDYVTQLVAHGGPDVPHLAAGNAAEGLQLFAVECAACHAWSGSGSIIYDGKVPTVVPATPEQVASAVRIGPGEMPAFGTAAIDDQQLNDLVTYVSTLKNKKDEGGYGLFHRGPTTEGAAALLLGLGSMLLAIGWIGTRARHSGTH